MYHHFGRRNPLEIGVQLRNLVNRGDFLTVQYEGGQLVTQILDVDVRARTFSFDWGALPEQNKGTLASPTCTFRASPEGVRVEFSTVTPQRNACSRDCPRSRRRSPKCCFTSSAASTSASTRRSRPVFLQRSVA